MSGRKNAGRLLGSEGEEAESLTSENGIYCEALIKSLTELISPNATWHESCSYILREIPFLIFNFTFLCGATSHAPRCFIARGGGVVSTCKTRREAGIHRATVVLKQTGGVIPPERKTSQPSAEASEGGRRRLSLQTKLPAPRGLT